MNRKSCTTKLNKPLDFSTDLTIMYLALLALCIAIYALLQIFVDDKGTATNLMIWSATLFAPIAVIYGLRYWKMQRWLGTRIDVLEKSRKKLEKLMTFVNDYRNSNDAELLINKPNVYDSMQYNFITKFEITRVELLSYFQLNDLYLHDDLDRLNEICEKLIEVPNAFKQESNRLVSNVAFHKTLLGNKLKKDYFALFLVDPESLEFFLNPINPEIGTDEYNEHFNLVVMKYINELNSEIKRCLLNAYNS
ncbi:hypothetical protein [Acinetobacter proteolyticus]|uniref:hypothetical protein n=1 Tax=Acinetobacter proteolyticus TaxID=1776741 RepID=UPI0031DB0BBE